MDVKFEVVTIDKPQDVNVIVGQAHFIKTLEDIYEVLVGSVPGIKFGIAFSEASGKCLVRLESNDENLRQLASDSAIKAGCGHVFFVFIKNAYPINVLNQIKMVPEVCRIFCATANPLQLIVAQTSSGRGISAVIDGASALGVEGPDDVLWRKDLLRKIGYKQ